MTGFGVPRPGDGDEATFDGYDEFVPETLPEPGEFLAEGDVLAGDDHVAFHRATRDVFEARGVYDVTFGYNLARLNLDRRHPDAGYRYAEGEDGALRAEFTPTTPFCPQSNTLTVGSFRAWNGLADEHAYDLVRVRVSGHQAADAINDTLATIEERYERSGSIQHATLGVDERGDPLADGSTGPANEFDGETPR